MKLTNVLIFIAVAMAALQAAGDTDTCLRPAQFDHARQPLVRRALLQERSITQAFCPMLSVWRRGVEELQRNRQFERGEPGEEAAI